VNASGRVRAEALVAAAFAALLSYAQRVLSAQVRMVRRSVVSVSGTIELRDGSREPLGPPSLLAAPETALRALAAATVALAVGLALFRAG
jgi:hypothetical protein